MRQVLMVAYYFPPLGGIGSVRLTAFASHLPEHGWEATVLAPRDGAYYRDPELRFPEERVVRTPSLELSRLGKQVLRSGGDDVQPSQVGGVRAALRSLARSTLYFPDPQVGWYAPAVLSSRRALQGRQFDAIFSSSFPITAHLVARRIHRWLRVPWIAEFRDPWSQTLPANSRTRARATHLERAIAREATALVMTSPSWAAQHSELWGRPVAVIPNGHEGVLSARVSHEDRFTLAYLGSYYPATQNLGAVWEAIATISRNGGPTVDRLQFIGELHPALEQELSHYGLMSLVEVTGFLPHDEALSRLATASAVLAAGPIDASGILRGHVVAKLPEYLATDLPLIYVGDTDCDAADVLRRHVGCHVVASGDAEAVIEALRASRNRRLIERDVQSLSRAVLTGRLAEVFDRAVDA